MHAAEENNIRLTLNSLLKDKQFKEAVELLQQHPDLMHTSLNDAAYAWDLSQYFFENPVIKSSMLSPKPILTPIVILIHEGQFDALKMLSPSNILGLDVKKIEDSLKRTKYPDVMMLLIARISHQILSKQVDSEKITEYCMIIEYLYNDYKEKVGKEDKIMDESIHTFATIQSLLNQVKKDDNLVQFTHQQSLKDWLKLIILQLDPNTTLPLQKITVPYTNVVNSVQYKTELSLVREKTNALKNELNQFFSNKTTKNKKIEALEDLEKVMLNDTWGGIEIIDKIQSLLKDSTVSSPKGEVESILNTTLKQVKTNLNDEKGYNALLFKITKDNGVLSMIYKANSKANESLLENDEKVLSGHLNVLNRMVTYLEAGIKEGKIDTKYFMPEIKKDVLTLKADVNRIKLSDTTKEAVIQAQTLMDDFITTVSRNMAKTKIGFFYIVDGSQSEDFDLDEDVKPDNQPK